MKPYVSKDIETNQVRVLFYCEDEKQQEAVYATLSILAEPLGILINKTANMSVHMIEKSLALNPTQESAAQEVER